MHLIQVGALNINSNNIINNNNKILRIMKTIVVTWASERNREHCNTTTTIQCYQFKWKRNRNQDKFSVKKKWKKQKTKKKQIKTEFEIRKHLKKTNVEE